MASEVRIRILGLDAALRESESRRAGVRAAQLSALDFIAQKVIGRVQRLLSGPVLKVRSGRYRRSFTSEVQSTDPPRAMVGTNVVYGPIHEFGGVTRPHVIVPRRSTILGRQAGSRVTGMEARQKRLLVFFWPKLGRVVAFPKVNHPGSNIPERPHLRPSLAASAGDLRSILREKVAAAIGARGGGGAP